MLDTVFGLPLHPLVVHATVVMVPLAALLVAISAVHARFRAWAGPVPAVTAVLALILVPITTGSGESLQDRVAETGLVHDHAEIAETLIWFVLPLAAVAVLGYWFQRRGGLGRGLMISLATASVVLAGATLVDVALIGHSGAKASWSTVAQNPVGDHESD